MADIAEDAEFRARMLAAVRKGLSGQLDISKTKKPGLQGYIVDSARERAVTNPTTRNHILSNEIKDVTPLPPVSVNRYIHQSGKGTTASLAYHATSAGPDSPVCKVRIVELPQAQRYRKTFGFLQTRCPSYIPVNRWKACVEDGKRFLAKWGNQAESLGWTSADLFGLHTPPDNPHPSYSRLSRYDCTGLCWLLQGREVITLTADTASLRNPKTGTITVFRKTNRPALGPLGDSLDDFR